MQRTATYHRKTKETDIEATVTLDGQGASTITTGIGFFDHMLEAFSRHSLIDITVKAQGDLHIDAHHTVEDTGYTVAEAFRKALSDKKGIYRFGSAYAPLDESLARAVVDLSGRSYLVCKTYWQGNAGELDAALVQEFFRAFAEQAEMNIHLEVLYGSNLHHQIEAVFKAFALALRQAVRIDARVTGVPSTKGTL